MASAKTSSQNVAVSRLPGLLRKVVANPKPEVVHQLRITIRRVETALRGSEYPEFPRLSKQLKKIRKRAGEVRDLDVQLTLLKGLNRPHDKDAIAVASALQEKREKQERKIKKLVTKEIDDNILKRLRKVSSGQSVARFPAQGDLATIAREFSEASGNQALTRANLHEFRTVTKKLRYRAELVPESAERDELTAALKKVQDAIGQWHDGVTLSETASEVIGDSKRNSLVSLLGTQNQSRFLEAVRSVERWRISIGSMFAEPRRKKPSGSETMERKHEAVGA